MAAFIDHHRDRYGVEAEVYRNGSGKSVVNGRSCPTPGWQRRYQLGGKHGVSIYAPAVLDEAFDKDGSEFIASAINIFA